MDDVVVTSEAVFALSTGVVRVAPRPTDLTTGAPIELGDPIDITNVPPALRAFRGNASWIFGIDAAIGRNIVVVDYGTKETKTAVTLPIPADCERAVDFTSSPGLPQGRNFGVLLRCSAAPVNRVYSAIADPAGVIQHFEMTHSLDADEAIVATSTGAAFSGRFVFLGGGKKRLAEYCVTPTLRAPIGIVGASP